MIDELLPFAFAFASLAVGASFTTKLLSDKARSYSERAQ
jgi:hypothetical protein